MKRLSILISILFTILITNVLCDCPDNSWTPSSCPLQVFRTIYINGLPYDIVCNGTIYFCYRTSSREIYIWKVTFDDPNCLDGYVYDSNTWKAVYDAIMFRMYMTGGAPWWEGLPPCGQGQQQRIVTTFTKGPCWKWILVGEQGNQHVEYLCCTQFGDGNCRYQLKCCLDAQGYFIDCQPVPQDPFQGGPLCPPDPLVFHVGGPTESDCHLICDQM